MSLWYAVSAFALIFAATGFLYWVLASNVVREDTRFSRDELENVRLILGATSGPGIGGASSRSLKVDSERELYVRLLARDGGVVLETPGMTAVVAAPSPALLATIRSPDGIRQAVVSRDDNAFQILTATIAPDGSVARGYVQVAINRGYEERLLSLYRRRLALVLSLSLIAIAVAG